MQVGVGEDGAQPLDVTVEIAAAAGLGQQSAQPRGGQLGGLGRGRRDGQDGAGIGAGQPAAGQPGERDNGGRVEVFEQVADLVADLLTRPYRVLLRTGQYPDGLSQLGVGGQGPLRIRVGADDVGQQHRVGGIGFGPRHRIPCPIPRGGQRVDRIDHPPGFAQRSHPQSMIGFDGHRDRMLGGIAGLGQKRQQLREAGRIVADPPSRHDTPIGVDHSHVVMSCGPIDSAIQVQGVTTPSIVRSSTSLGGVTRRPNRRTQRSVISLAVRDSSTPQDLVLSKSSKLGNNYREVNPAVGSGNGIPPPHHVICRQARRSFSRRPASGNTQASPGSRPVRKQTLVTTTRNPSLLND
jgi:hypothetical protein